MGSICLQLTISCHGRTRHEDQRCYSSVLLYLRTIWDCRNNFVMQHPGMSFDQALGGISNMTRVAQNCRNEGLSRLPAPSFEPVSYEPGP